MWRVSSTIMDLAKRINKKREWNQVELHRLCVIQYKVRGTDTAGVVLVIAYHCEIIVLNVLLSYQLVFVLCYSILKVLFFFFALPFYRNLFNMEVGI